MISHKGFIATEQVGQYITNRPVNAEDILAMANKLIRHKFARGHAITNPQLAVDYIKDNYPLAEGVKTILLLDINMPVLNGWNVLDKLKDMKLGNFVTYMLTSSIDLKDKEKAENNLLVSGFIEKPLDLEPFSALIKQNME